VKTPHEHDERKERKQSGKDDGPLDEVTRPVTPPPDEPRTPQHRCTPTSRLAAACPSRRRGIRPPHRPQQVVQQLVQRQRARDMERQAHDAIASHVPERTWTTAKENRGGTLSFETGTDACVIQEPLSGEKKHVVENGRISMKGR